jgi:hypothetical protein
MVRNLSFQRLTDREIVQWLHDEKQIDLDRSTISKMRLQVEKEATKWYIGIRESGSKYVAIYKERLDSLLCYQKRLNEIVDSYLPERIYPVSGTGRTKTSVQISEVLKQIRQKKL